MAVGVVVSAVVRLSSVETAASVPAQPPALHLGVMDVCFLSGNSSDSLAASR